MMKKKIGTIIFILSVYLLSSGASFAIFKAALPSGTTVNPLSGGKVNVTDSPQKKSKVDPSLPKNEVCPLNGFKYTALEKEDWEKRRPLAVMLENSTDARPQSGLSKADIIYEAIAEGWVTRFMAVYYCNTPFENIELAPIRSARSYYIDWLSEYDALYNHVGGSNRIGDNASMTDPKADSLGQIDRYGIKDLDQFGIGYPDCYRNPDRIGKPVATEHTMVCFTENLYKIAAKRDWTNVDEKGVAWDKNFKEWSFKDDPSSDKRGSSQNVKIVFSEGRPQYEAEWKYDSESNVYKRYTGGEPHLDLTTGEQIEVKNVVVQLTKLTGPVDAHGHFLYTTIGDGKAIIFSDGKATVGKWLKSSRIGRTKYSDNLGKDYQFTRGMIWIEFVPREEQVTY